MLQKKDYQQQHQQRYQATPTKTNATKEGLPTTPTTIKKSIVENQTSGKIKTNVTKEGLPTTTKIPTIPTKTNATKEGLPTTPTTMLQNKRIPNNNTNKN